MEEKNRIRLLPRLRYLLSIEFNGPVDRNILKSRDMCRETEFALFSLLFSFFLSTTLLLNACFTPVSPFAWILSWLVPRKTLIACGYEPVLKAPLPWLTSLTSSLFAFQLDLQTYLRPSFTRRSFPIFVKNCGTTECWVVSSLHRTSCYTPRLEKL